MICERWGRLDEYRRGEMALINELAEGWIFYSGLYQLEELERPLSFSQAMPMLTAAMGGGEEDEEE